MIVVDASFVVELLTNDVLTESLSAHLYGGRDPVCAPHLLDLEVISTVRRLVASGHFDPHRCGDLLVDLAELRVARMPHTPLLGRIWELRHNFTVYDAAYIALAEEFGAALYTCDRKLCKTHRARGVLFTDGQPSPFGPE